MLRPDPDEHRLLDPADILHVLAARVKDTTWRGIRWVWRLPAHDDPFRAAVRIGTRDGRKQGLRVRVLGVPQQFVGLSQFHVLTHVHDGDAIGDMAHDAQVVGDEEIGQTKLPLQVLEQIDDLRLHRDIQGGDGLVGQDHLRVQHQRPSDADPLPLSAAETVWIAPEMLDLEPH